MEQVESALKVDKTVYEKYGWTVLVISVILSIASALVTTLPPISWFWGPLYSSAYSIMGAWGISWVGFDLLALVIILVPFRRG